MKHLLFIVIALTGSFNAFARYSPADCRQALVAHVWRGQKFSKVGRLDGALDGASEASLLLRVKNSDQKIVIPSWSNLTSYPEQTFTSKSDGSTYALIHGAAEDLVAARHALAVVNRGRKLSFQVLDQDQIGDVKPKLSRELQRRAAVLAYIKVPFIKADGWLERFKAYRGFKRYMAKETAPLREGLAARLHRWRNPPTEVAPYVLSEVRSCTDTQCARQPAAVDLIQDRLERFSSDVGMGLKLDHAGSLSPLVVDLLSVLKPLDVDAHESAVRNAGLGDWDPIDMTRHKRQLALEKAWALIESALRGETVKAGQVTVGAIDEASVRYVEQVSSPLPSRTVTMAEWSNGALDAELFDPRFRALRARRPFTVVRDERDIRIVAFDPDWIFTGEDMLNIEDIGAAGGGVVGVGAIAHLNGGLEPVRLSAAEAHDTRRLRELAERQQVAVINADSRDHSIWLVPLKLEAEFHYDSSVRRATQLRLKPLNDFAAHEIARIGGEARSHVLTYVNPNGGETYSLEARLIEDATGRDQIHLSNLRHLEVDATEVVAEGAPLRAFAELVMRTHERAPQSVRGGQHLVLEQDGRAWHFDFVLERAAEGTDRVVITNVSEIKPASAVGFWTRLAKDRHAKAFDYTFVDAPGFRFGEDKIFRIQMSAWVAAKAATLHGFTVAQIHEILERPRNAVIDLKTSCANFENIEVCFGPQGGPWARVTEIRPSSRTTPGRD